MEGEDQRMTVNSVGGENDDEDARLKSPAFHLFVTPVATVIDLSRDQVFIRVVYLI